MGLTGSAEPEQLIASSSHGSAAVRVAAVAALRRLRHTGAEKFLNDKSEWVLREAVSAIHDDESILEALPSVANLLPGSDREVRGDHAAASQREPSRRTPENAQRLIDYALDKTKPSAIRAEAYFVCETGIVGHLSTGLRVAFGRSPNETTAWPSAWLKQTSKNFSKQPMAKYSLS